MEDPVYLSDERVLTRMLCSEKRQLEQLQSSCFESGFQKEISSQDRAVLAEWMRDVCLAEECQADTFPLSCQIVDHFLALVRTKRSQLQLLGATALLLASKLRQTQQIPAKYLIYYTKDLITMQELRTWELFVLTTLKWDLALITPVDYLDIFLRRLFPTQTSNINSTSNSNSICSGRDTLNTPPLDASGFIMLQDDEQRIAEVEDEAHRLIYECCLDYKYSLCLPSVIASTCLARAMDHQQVVSSAYDNQYLASNKRLELNMFHEQPTLIVNHTNGQQ